MLVHHRKVVPLCLLASSYNRVDQNAYERIYGAWWDRVVYKEAKTAVSRSAARYIQALQR